MKVLTNRIGSYTTGTEIADAVLRYGVALARRGDVDLVDIPFVEENGTISRVELTIGWQADIAAVSRTDAEDELVEADTILALYDKARAIGIVQAQAFSREELEEIRALGDWDG
jgi:hypothetical protein